MVNKLYNIFFILFLISFLSCMEKKGKDKHPEIPEFPITTNKNISIRAIISAYDDLYYNDSVIVYKKNDTVNIYNVLSNAKVKMLSNVLTYANGFFIIQKDKEYKAIDDKKFTVIELVPQANVKLVPEATASPSVHLIKNLLTCPGLLYILFPVAFIITLFPESTIGFGYSFTVIICVHYFLWFQLP